jgi:uncharacterized protein (TIGR02145 family)
MKNIFIFLIVLIHSISLFAAEPLLKYYLEDGSSKQYNLSEIDSLNFVTFDVSFWCSVYLSKNHQRTNFDVTKIEKISLDTTQIEFEQADKNISFTLSDVDSITFYPNIKLCDNIWMSKNLDVDHYANGDSIPEIRDSQAWMETTTGAWCHYNNDPSISKVYGKLYNWYAVNDPRGLAPKGWHVASADEWMTLLTCLGGSNVAGGKIKEKGTAHWASPNMNATNDSGFTALPAGDRQVNGSFLDLYGYAYWWSSTEFYVDAATGWAFGVMHLGASVGNGGHVKLGGESVRCIKD